MPRGLRASVVSLTCVLAALCVGATSTGLLGKAENSPVEVSQALKVADGGLGPPISAWYFSLKTSKGYCGLVPLSTTAGGYGFAISCANKYPVYDSQFTLLSADAPSSPGRPGWAGAGAAAAAAASPAAAQPLDSAADRGAAGVGISAISEAAAGEAGSLTRPGLQPDLEVVAKVAAGQRERERRGSTTEEARRVRRLLAGTADPRAHLEDHATVMATAAITDDAAAVPGVMGAIGAAAMHDPNAPVVITSGTPLRLLSRSAGLCGSVPPPAPKSLQQQEDEQQPQPAAADHGEEEEEQGVVRGAAALSDSAPCSRLIPAAWCAWLWCRAAPALQLALNTLSRALHLPQPFSLSAPSGCVHTVAATRPSSGSAAGVGAGTAAGSGSPAQAALQDTAPWPVTCVLAQPGSLQWRLFKSDLKDNATVDLAADWLYLMEGDKYCTLADVAGMTAVVSCHLDSPGWTGYKFQLQTLSYPRSQLASQLTGGECSVRLPSLPPPHDWACGGPDRPPSPDRSPDFDLVLQTPGSALAAGVVVGITTYSHGLVGNQLQRCCPMTSSPHIIFCEIPVPGSVPPAECWFQLYDVKLLRAVRPSEAIQDPALLGGGDDADAGRGGSSGGGRQEEGFWGAFARSLFAEMSPVVMPDMDDADELAPARQVGAAIVEESGAGDAGELEEEEDVGLVAELAAAAGRLRFPWDAVAPITDGSLVMFMSKAFARYCSVSVDGDLLCVSAQASNASRNLFTLRLPPLPPLAGAARVRARAGQAAVGGAGLRSGAVGGVAVGGVAEVRAAGADQAELDVSGR